MQGVCIGVYAKWSNSSTNWSKKGILGGKKYLHAYFYDENGKIHSKRVSRTEAIRLRLQGFYKRKLFVCQVCQYKFLGLIKHDKDVPDCPRCK